MRRVLWALSLFLGVVMPISAEEIAMRDGTKIVGHMTSIQGDKIEVETAYGKMQLKRADILTISFPENGGSAVPAAAAPKDAPQSIDESLRGTQYINKTGKFTLTLPVQWRINPKLQRTAPIIAALSSQDEMRFLTVTQEEFTGSLESYKGLLELKYRRTFGGYEELSESPAKIDGKAALLLTFRGISTKADNLPVEFLVAIIPSGTTYTRIATWCVEPLFRETQPMFEGIVNSYHGTAPSTTAEVRK